jgi:hypothetical protein
VEQVIVLERTLDVFPSWSSVLGATLRGLCSNRIAAILYGHTSFGPHHLRS